VVGLLTGPTPELRPVTWSAAEGVASLGWLVLAVRARRSQRGRTRTSGWTSWALMLMAGGEALLGVDDLADSLAGSLAAGLQLCAAVIIVTAGAADLWQIFVLTDQRTASLCDDLVGTRLELGRVELRQQERLHDARSVVLGVIGASRLLARPERSTDADRLGALMTQELTRLSAVLDPSAADPLGDFSLASAIEPVLLVHQLGGAEVRCELGELWVRGRIRDTATVFANLLANCQLHAPGATVTVSAVRRLDRVVIDFEDDGPGIPAAERAQVLTRGGRGADAGAGGSGLGLYTAAQAMSAQAGTLEIRDRKDIQDRSERGTRIVLTLPVAEHIPAGDRSAPAW